MSTLIIMTAIAIIATIIGFVLIGRMLNTFEEAFDFYFTTLMNQMNKEIKEVTAMKEDLDVAIAKLPVSRSKKVQKIEETTETIETKVDE